MAFLDLQGRVAACNPALEDFLGRPAAELTGVRLLTAFSPPQDAAIEAEYFLELVDGKRDRYHVEKRYRRKDRATVWGSVTVGLVPGGGSQRPFCLAAIEDITRQKQTQEGRQRAAKLDALARMAEELVVRLNHVMLASLGSSQLLMESLPNESPARELVASVREGVERSATLTRQLVAFASRQLLSPEPCDLNAIVRRLLPRIQRSAGDHIQVETVLEPSLARVQADPTQLERAIWEIVENAIEAMPDGGELRIATCHSETPSDRSEATQSQVVLAIRDSGVGMDDKALDRVFEPFFSTKQRIRDAGLGLAGVHGIIRQCGGHIDVASSPGEGTEFRILFPRSVETLLDFELPAGLADTKQTTETILLVEDDDRQRGLYRQILDAAGYRVLEARYGGEALLLCLRHEGPIHALLADAALPQMSGTELAEQAVGLRPDLKVVLLGTPVGGSDTSQDVPAVWLSRPVSRETLVGKLRELFSIGNHADVSRR
jgi:PAS domain S-box-containing protein